MLSVAELRQRKQQLEQTIAELIQVFEHCEIAANAQALGNAHSL